MRIAVTGAAGTVGPFLVEELSAHGHDVVGIDIREPVLPLGIPMIQASVEDPTALEAAFDRADMVVHLAAYREPGLATADETFRLNALGTLHAIEAAVNAGAHRFVLASSDATLGFAFQRHEVQPDYFPVDEDHPLRPQDDYGLSKVVAEEICRSYTRKGAIATACLRHCYFWTLANGEEALEVVRDVDRGVRTLWSYIHARDCARAYRLALEHPDIEHETLFVVAGDVRVDVSTADLVNRYFPDVPVRASLGPYSSLISGAKAYEILGFTPSHSWRDEVSSASGAGSRKGRRPGRTTA